MKVKAKRRGYYGEKRRYEGDVFDLVPIKLKDGSVVAPEKQLSDWMERIDQKASAKTEKAQAKEQPADRPSTGSQEVI